MPRGRRPEHDISAIRRRCQQHIDTLDLSGPLDVATLSQRLAAVRARPLHLLGLQQRGPGPTGLWVATDAADYVFYNGLARRLHRDHIILHEIGHILLDHRASATLTADTARLLAPNLDPDVVRRTLSRTNYSEVEEQEAEMFASLMMPRLEALLGADLAVAPDEVADTLRRFAAVFGFTEDPDV